MQAHNRKNILADIRSWKTGRNTSGQTGLVLLRDAITDAFLHSMNWQPIAAIASINEPGIRKNVKNILSAFGWKIQTDEKQTYGLKITGMKPGDKDTPEFALLWSRLEKAVAEKLSIAGSKISKPEFFGKAKTADNTAKDDENLPDNPDAVPGHNSATEPEIGEIVGVDLSKFEQAFAALEYADQAILLAKLQEIHTQSAPLMIAAG